MDVRQNYSREERHFVLHLMNFVYGMSGRPLHFYLKSMLDEFPKEKESYCTKNITQAILIYIADYRTSNATLLDIASSEYQSQIDEFPKFYDDYAFLQFLAHYSWKSARDYYKEKIFESPVKFFSSIVRLLEAMRKSRRHDINFWKLLDEAAERVIQKDLEIMKFRNRQLRSGGEKVDLTAEQEFVLEVMKMVYLAHRKPFPDCLRRELDELLLKSQLEMDRNRLETALAIAMKDLEINICHLGSDEAICDYYYRLSKSSFNAKNFLEFCVCFTRSDCFKSSRSPRKSYDRFMTVLESAKQEGNIISFGDLMHGVDEIISDDKERKAALERDNALYASTKPKSEWELLIAPRQNTRIPRSAAENVIASDSNSEPAADNVAISEENTQAANVNVTTSDKNEIASSESTVQAGESDNLIASCVHKDSSECCKNCCTTT